MALFSTDSALRVALRGQVGVRQVRRLVAATGRHITDRCCRIVAGEEARWSLGRVCVLERTVAGGPAAVTE
jgi:hypothetical protein